MNDKEWIVLIAVASVAAIAIGYILGQKFGIKQVVAVVKSPSPAQTTAEQAPTPSETGKVAGSSVGMRW